jgi:tetratricopeptide (TPR) repeat protein
MSSSLSAAATSADTLTSELSQLRVSLDALLLLSASYFPTDSLLRTARLSEQSSLLATRAGLAVAAATSASAPAPIRAALLLIQGRALDAAGGFSPEAEATLTRAVRLDASRADAWAALGHVQWKKPDIESARESFAASLEREPTPLAHRSLAQLARAHAAASGGGSAAANAEAAATAVRHAKAAVQLDMSDATSWAALGVAHLTEAASVSFSAADVKRSRAAFTRAATLEEQAAMRAIDVDDVPVRDPDLHFNRGHALAYAEDYVGAIASFKFAAEIDPSLPSPVSFSNPN